MSISRFVIVGGGTAGWMTAACLARVLGTRHYKISLIEAPDIPTVGVGEATIPMIDLFHQLLQITPFDLVRETEATFKLGIEFVDWRAPGTRYFHPFGQFGADMNGISFFHFWLRQSQHTGEEDIGAYNLETLAARSGRFSF